MANLGIFPGLGPTRAEFDNNTILNAPNPDPLLGYAYGPIPNNNPGWKPTAYTTAIAAGNLRYDIKAADIAATPRQTQLLFSTRRTQVCDIVISPPSQMCGLVFPEGPALRRHIRNEYSGAVVNPSRRAKTQPEIIAGQNAIRRWVLEGGWRDASYLHKPGRGPDNGMVGHWASALERIAATDAQFAVQYGTRFYR
ncbi:uncharacterized protein N7473_000045 [Penicillium subrubescens]|uniref:uncharacterized protein n=1 Tax=Penicillium subrubescens TaxID=1316194 RepID=UPI0025458706|nr:uncharacterized protein N7473_000045 [Penicillium subrubescens]KAJ5910742.1 hypothetical protein N7473_000045 [Penicillium subrubescens]